MKSANNRACPCSPFPLHSLWDFPKGPKQLGLHNPYTESGRCDNFYGVVFKEKIAESWQFCWFHLKALPPCV